MAAKDTEPYLPDCLDSIVQQTYQNWELIAVNDHSSDRTPEILAEYASRDVRVRVFHSKRPLLIPTLQEGYAQAKGDLINRMDSDDKMPDYKLEVLVKKWLEHGKGSLVVGGTQHFVDEGEVGDGFLKYENWLNEVAARGSHKEEIYTECVTPSHSWIVHREDFERVGAFDPEVYPEDYDLCFRFYKAGIDFVPLNKVLHYWRDRGDRISRTWDCYKDNRYFELKLRYFYEIDRDSSRKLVVWGAGKNGKDLVKLLQKKEHDISWVCDNPKKIGKHIYDIKMQSMDAIPAMDDPQILIAVTSRNEKELIREKLSSWGKKPVEDFWFFL